MYEPVSPINWCDDYIEIIDQTCLPCRLVTVKLRTVEDVWDAVKKLRVRGAPAIGIVAAMGLYLAVKDSKVADKAGFITQLKDAAAYLSTSRPTAVNLFWALERVVNTVEKEPTDDIARLKAVALQEAVKIRDEDEEMCRRIGMNGAELIRDMEGVLTHCNAGTLATARYGTALAPIYHLAAQGKTIKVYVGETRPLLQGARLTAWELKRAGIPVTVITDSMAATVMARGYVQGVMVGADRIVANGDVANKIGTYGLAILAREHGLPFYIAAPTTTFDLTISEGGGIPIEEREPAEICNFGLRATVPEGVNIFNPAFDITPNRYITAIITEKGNVYPPYRENIPRLING